MRRMLSVLTLLVLALACSTYNETVQPVKVPAYQSQKVEVEGAYIVAEAYADPSLAKEKFGFDIRGAGILPVQVVIQNQGRQTLVIDADQTLLIDDKGNGWPILSTEQVYKRIKGKVELGEAAKGAVKPSILGAAAGAIAGAAIAIVTGENVGKGAGKGAAAGAAAGAIIGGAQGYATVEEKVKSDILNKTIKNRVIEPGELVYGFLFFPGKKNEAKSAKVLRLALRFGKEGRVKVVEIPLTKVE